jgi:hypothetical protein
MKCNARRKKTIDIYAIGKFVVNHHWINLLLPFVDGAPVCRCFPGGLKSSVPFGLIFGGPIFHVPFGILPGILAFIRQGVLHADILQRQGEDFEGFFLLPGFF